MRVEGGKVRGAAFAPVLCRGAATCVPVVRDPLASGVWQVPQLRQLAETAGVGKAQVCLRTTHWDCLSGPRGIKAIPRCNRSFSLMTTWPTLKGQRSMAL